jgi:hypothetical protein
MPRIIRHIHEYYDNRIVRGLYCQIVNEGLTLRVIPGAAVINENLVSVNAAVDLAFNQHFVVDNNTKRRTDIVVCNTAGVISVIHGTPGEALAPKCPPLSLLIAQITLPPGLKKFVGVGAEDEVLSIRSQHVIDTRFSA